MIVMAFSKVEASVGTKDQQTDQKNNMADVQPQV